MYKMLSITGEVPVKYLENHHYILDPTHVYWYKKIADGVEIEIQNRDNDLYVKGQVILHCTSACIIEDLSELKEILDFSMNDQSYNYLLSENERLNRIIDEYEEVSNRILDYINEGEDK